jgi:peptidoglycan/LPS O-acetylase OafA/YrhL
MPQMLAAVLVERSDLPQINNNITPRSHSDYIYGVDLVRFASAVGVAAFHFNESSTTRAFSLLFGWVGVQVFFVISGLVIANSAQGASARHFVVNRFLRLYPVAWCASIICLPLFLWRFGIHSHWFLPLLYSIILIRFPHANFLAGAYWTLPVEMSFYCLVFLLIKFNSFDRIQWLSFFLILWGAPYSFALMLNSYGVIHWAWVDIGFGPANMLLFRHGPYFGLGILVWLYKEKRITKIGVIAAGFALLLGLMEIYGRTVQYKLNITGAGYGLHGLITSVVLWAEIEFYALVMGTIYMTSCAILTKRQRLRNELIPCVSYRSSDYFSTGDKLNLIFSRSQHQYCNDLVYRISASICRNDTGSLTTRPPSPCT